MATEGKPHISVCVVGHVDAGKSTTTGHLLFKLGGYDQRTLDKLTKEAADNGKKGFEFAYVMDTEKAERERGVTIKSTSKEFFTPNYHYTIVDCPGHKDYIGNMISGSSTAEVAMLMFPASKGAFETAIAKGDEEGVHEGQTRQHARLLNISGIKQVICCVNKIDDVPAAEAAARFNEIKDEAARMLAQAGYGGGKVENVLKTTPFIPISGFLGHNLTEKSDKLPWYKGYTVNKLDNTSMTGHTLLDALNDYAQLPKRDDSKPLRMPVQSVLKMKIGTIVCGRLEQGVLKPGQMVKFVPSGIIAQAFSLEMHQKSLETAHAGDNIGINLKKFDKTPGRGEVMVLADENVFEVYEFTCQLKIEDHPGELKKGYSPQAMVRTAHAASSIQKINWRMGKDTGKTKSTSEEHCKMIKQGDFAEVVFKPQKPLYLTTYEECEGLGRVAFLDSGRLVSVAKITSVTYLTPELKKQLDAQAKAEADAKRAAQQAAKKKK